jgi:LysR family hydrogen peroxide-inducible transcriptional activator
LTEAGQVAITKMRQILSSVQALDDECKAFNKVVRGSLKIGIIPTIGPYLIPYFLENLNKSYPELHIQLIEEKTEYLMRELSFGRIDAAILATPKKTPGDFVERPLYYEPFVLYASQGHELLSQHDVPASKLSQFSVTLLDETHCMRDQVSEACGLAAAKARGAIQLATGSLQTLISIVDKSHSYTLIPKLAENVLHFDHPRSGLREIKAVTPYRKVSLLLHPSFSRKSLIDAFYSVLQSSLPDGVSQKSPRSGVMDVAKSLFTPVPEKGKG